MSMRPMSCSEAHILVNSSLSCRAGFRNKDESGNVNDAGKVDPNDAVNVDSNESGNANDAGTVDSNDVDNSKSPSKKSEADGYSDIFFAAASTRDMLSG